MFALFLATGISIEIKKISTRNQLALDQYGFEQGGTFSIHIYLKPEMNFTLSFMTRENFNYAKNRNMDFCNQSDIIGNYTVERISDQISFVNWTGQIQDAGVYRPVITVCSTKVEPYSVTYKADNPISHLDSRYTKSPFVSELFAFLFLFFAVVGILNWALNPQFLIPVLISNTLTSIFASLLFTSYYLYYTHIPISQETPLRIRLSCSIFISLTIMCSLVTGHMTACGFSIISLDVHTKTAIINIITTIIMGICLFLMDFGINMNVTLVAGFIAIFTLVHILYSLMTNLSNLVELKYETSDQTSVLKIRLAFRATLTWVCSLVLCLIAAPQEVGQNLLFGLAASLAAQNGGLSFLFSFSGGYIVENEIKNENDLVYIEDPTSEKSLSFIAAESA
ncbi:hypothetical protein TVAG_185550 [Trichomonas vaginalis G3]|uniref:Intimal thickness related receptor IRP domain-containing protein n=1 Tax=Trichomonas vaginalis (strain ATCC PRA-98 / G3) TaxID=412133 RepID=A2D8J9_TRIV3|nr:lung seven transmembrane receptor family [Trichomonas vaginalis G3]EAY23248.1 hypothetical protein TVAG_185550 [Trichomonas vaginalis G3]KAI5534103.1 lung seven transmembrane receptor family [Trichomonas vaginalis G3]|eukprot:XP_001584234.1 hypothetical protein [Trichomonas vaginalis G3]